MPTCRRIPYRLSNYSSHFFFRLSRHGGQPQDGIPGGPTRGQELRPVQPNRDEVALPEGAIRPDRAVQRRQRAGGVWKPGDQREPKPAAGRGEAGL